VSTYNRFTRFFKGVSLEVEDLFLLESFQIGYFPGWVPEREFAAVLQAHPSIKRFLVKRCPAITDFVERVLSQFEPAVDQDRVVTIYHKVTRSA